MSKSQIVQALPLAKVMGKGRSWRPCVHIRVDLGRRSLGAGLTQQQPLFIPRQLCRDGITAQQLGYHYRRLVTGTQAGHQRRPC